MAHHSPPGFLQPGGAVLGQNSGYYIAPNATYDKLVGFTTEQVITFTQDIIQQGRAFTWDVPAQPDGLIPDSFMEQLEALHQALSN